MFLGITDKSKTIIQLIDSGEMYVGICLPVLQSILSFLHEG